MSTAEGRPQTPGITDLGHDVYEIDTRMAGYPGITAGYLIRGDRPCLVETGTAPSAPVVRDALAALGVGPADLATVVVTHIHLDHAGGTGDIAAMYPGAEVVVHERGARHLADPARLMASARMVYGDALDRLFGTMRPTPADRIVSVAERGRIDLGGGRWLDSHYSPGHAKHHVGLIDSVSGDLYVGDAAGVYIPETGDLRPATPPPDFDLDTALNSLRMFAALRPQRLLFSHYGPVRTWPRRCSARPRRSRSGWRRPGGPGTPGLTSITRWPWWGADQAAVRGAGARTPTRTSRPSSRRSAAPQANVAGIMHWLDRENPS